MEGLTRAHEYRLPCYLDIGGKRIALNLNWYRNAHYQVLAKAKREFSPLESPPRFSAHEIAVEYVLLLPSKRRTDLMNWVAVVDKFFLDYLVADGVVEDDSADYIRQVSARAVYAPGIGQTQMIAKVFT